MSIWLAIPSARPGAGTVYQWLARGYSVAIWLNPTYNIAGVPPAGLRCMHIIGEYLGYARAVNALVKEILARDTEASWIVTGGDDVEPEPIYSPDEIAQQCTHHFQGTFGVMQPTGDRWAQGSIDKICGSPWMGREFCERIYRGQGPLWPEFTHMFVDEHLQHVAQTLGILWQRPDLTQKHNHFCRAGEAVDWGQGRREMPEFLREPNSPEHWARSKAIFERLRAGGFSEALDLLPARSLHQSVCQ